MAKVPKWYTPGNLGTHKEMTKDDGMKARKIEGYEAGKIESLEAGKLESVKAGSQPPSLLAVENQHYD